METSTRPSTLPELTFEQRRQIALELIGKLLTTHTLPLSEVLQSACIHPTAVIDPDPDPFPQDRLTAEQHSGDACCNCGSEQLNPYFVAVKEYRISDVTGEHLLICDHCNQLDWHKLYGTQMGELLDAQFPIKSS